MVRALGRASGSTEIARNPWVFYPHFRAELLYGLVQDLLIGWRETKAACGVALGGVVRF